MSIRLFGNAILTLLLLVAPMASAHEGHKHGGGAPAKGTVESVEGSKLTVKGADGKLINVHVDDRTAYEKGRAPGAAAEVTAGTRVVVHGEKMKDGTLHATKVRYSAASRKVGAAVAPAGTSAGDGADSHAGHQHGAAPSPTGSNAAVKKETPPKDPKQPPAAK